MIALFTGPPGSGKSWAAVRTMVDALEQRRWVATNVQLTDDAPERVANRNIVRWLVPGRRRALAKRYSEHIYISADPSELMRLRLPGCGRCSRCRKSQSCRREGRGVMVLDEAHLWLNSRTWDQTADGKANKQEAVRKRLEIVSFFSQHRHLGWDIYLITQDAENIDRQVRGLFEYHVKLRNLRRFKLLGIPVVPCNVFLAIWMWHGANKSIVKRQTYRLSKLANIYDTMASADDTDDRDDVIRLGAEPAPDPAPRPGGSPPGAGSEAIWTPLQVSPGDTAPPAPTFV